MAPETNSRIHQLPIIPEELLRRHRVLEKFDTRFRAAARLLQALWREEQQLPIGTHDGRDGRQRRIGSLLGSSAAAAGRNFLTPAIAHLARRETVYQERGALIHQGRLYGNLLSSMPLAFNLFAPLCLDLDLAARVIRALIPDIDLAKVTGVWFEHSPGRDLADLTGDRTAFDIAITYQRRDGETGLLAIEQKYSESPEVPSAPPGPRYDELAELSELYKHPANAILRASPYAQLFREHLLTFAAVHRGDYAEARFILIAPRHNHLQQQSATNYAAHLMEPGPGQVPFLNIELERVIEALAWAGEFDHAARLWDRYCNFWKVDLVVEEALRAKGRTWTLNAPTVAAPVGLIAKAP